MKAFLLVVLSVVVIPLLMRFLYGVFLQHLEAKLRGWLARKRPEWRRRRYVRAFVGALQGRAELADAVVRTGFAIFAVLFVGTAIVASGIVAIRATGNAEAALASATANLREAERNLDALEASNKQFAELSDALKKASAQGSVAAPPVTSEAQPSATYVEEKREELATLRKEFEEATKRDSAKLAIGKMFGKFSIGLGSLYGLFLLYLTFAWMPTMLATRVFSFHVSRFLLRIQAIATPEEVAKLSRAEVAVRDEASLKAFVGLAVATARAHDAESIALHLDLWDAFSAPNQTPAAADEASS
jgi:hypothetical protein